MPGNRGGEHGKGFDQAHGKTEAAVDLLEKRCGDVFHAAYPVDTAVG